MINLIFYIIIFLFSDLKQFTVTKDGIDIKYLITRKQYHIAYSEILRFKANQRKIYHKVEKNLGYQELEIHLIDDEVIVINGGQFKNYDELKECIYLNRNNTL
jgi:hypothetical protein